MKSNTLQAILKRKRVKAKRKRLLKMRPGSFSNPKNWPKLRLQGHQPACQMCHQIYITAKSERPESPATFSITRRRENIHHIFPRRWLKSLGKTNFLIHSKENFCSLCSKCHPLIRTAEDKIFKADYLGYLQELNRIGFPMSLVERAKEHLKL